MNIGLRQAGLVGAVGGALTVIAGVVVQGVVLPASDVSDDMWSYPWSSGAFVAVSVFYALLHALVFAGVLGFARSGVAGPGRGARVGTGLALTGIAVLGVAELLSITAADRRIGDGGTAPVAACYVLGTVLASVGFIMAGVATMRSRGWDGWRRLVPLVTGISFVAVTGLAPTPALNVAITINGLFLTALGVALWTQPTPARPRSEAVQVRL